MSGGLGSRVFYYTDDNANAVADMADAAAAGRGGLGMIMVKSSGNSRAAANSTAREEGTAELWDSTRHSISVAAVERDGDITNYSSPGANVLISAFAPSTGQSPGIYTTDQQGSAGYNSTDYTSSFNGTSAAAPQIAGVVALMLEANPDLGWRDVQKILALTARQSGSEVGATAIGNEQATSGSSTWLWNDASVGSSNLHWNNGGLHFSNDYGFGIVDALAAVRLAETWELTGTSATEASESRDVGANNFLVGTSFVNQTATFSSNVIVQHVRLNVEFDIDDLDDMEIFLISPNGTRIQMINDTGDTANYDTDNAVNNSTGFGGTGGRGWDFGAVGFLGEQGNGTWTVQFRNDDGATNGAFAVKDVDLYLYGDTATSDDLFVYTNEFSDYDGVGGHGTSATGGSGVNTINAAAVSSNTTIDLLFNTGTIDGVAITNTNINRVFTGDGNDTVIGDGFSQYISTGRGNDSIVGGSGDETLIGGTGNDTLEGGGGADRLDGGDGNDTFAYVGNVTAANGNDNLIGGAGNDKIFIDGANGTVVNLTDINVNSIEEIEFRGNGSNFDRTVILSNKELDSSFEFATDLLIDGNSSGSTSVDTIVVNIDFGENLDISGWTFTDWVSGIDRIVLNGNADGNVIKATSEADSIDGGAGNDSILGNAGNDTLDGGTGADTLDGGLGDDVLIKSTAFSGGDDVYNGGAGNDTLVANTAWGSNVVFNLGAGNASVNGTARDTLTSIENIDVGGSAQVIGSFDANIIRGTSTSTSANNNLDGGAGNDTILGGAGNDTIEGGSGIDSIDGGAGNDLILINPGWTGGDTNDGGAGVDTFQIGFSTSGGYAIDLAAGTFAGGGDTTSRLFNIENLIVSNGNDTLTGSSAANRLEGLGGDDVINGGGGADTLLGGDGNDTLTSGGAPGNVMSGGAGDDVLITTDNGFGSGEGGAGIDLYDISAGVGGGNIYTYDMSAGGGVALGGGPNFFTFIDEFENLNAILSSGGAIVTGNAKANRITGSNAADTIDGGAGNDTLLGGDGDDRLSVTSGFNNLSGGAGDDYFNMSAAGGNSGAFSGQTLDGGTGTDTVDYSNYTFSDAGYLAFDLDQGYQFNSIVGPYSGSWSDLENFIGVANRTNHIVANSSANKLTGGAGNDTIIGENGNDTLIGGNGADDLDGGGNDDILKGGGGKDLLKGGGGNDNLNGGGDNDTLRGQGGDDTLDGRGGDDTLRGQGGEDILKGGGGDDNLNRGTDNDTLNGEVGNDTLIGRAGDDVLDGGDGDDLLVGGGGDDAMNGGGDNDTLEGDIGNDTLEGRAGDDVLDGGDGDDLLVGGGGDDAMNGGGDNDTLEGQGGNDMLEGRAGDDILDGGTGDDRLDGGGGADRFVFNGNFGDDKIIDFDFSDAEKIDLSGVAGLNSFSDVQNSLSVGNGGVAIINAGANSITLTGITAADFGVSGPISADDFIF